MKTSASKYMVVVLLALAAGSANGQRLLLDSLKGTWTMSEQYNNKERVIPQGTFQFFEDGTFRSNGSYFGTAVGMYRTDETKSTIQIEIAGKTSEWNATVRNHILRMVKPKHKKAPRVELVLMSEFAEVNSGN